MKSLKITTALLMLCSTAVHAEVSSTVGIYSNYLFNGVSQTSNNAALQASLDWSQNGAYLSIWGSNVDFGDTNLEADIFAGYVYEINPEMNLDVGIAQYTYHGDSNSSDANYPEIWAKLRYNQWQVSYWYSWDYFGTDAGHSIWMLSHDIQISDQISLSISVDRSASHDEDKYTWGPNDDAYVHWQTQASYTTKHFDIHLSFHHVDLDNLDDDQIVLGISKTFGF